MVIAVIALNMCMCRQVQMWNFAKTMWEYGEKKETRISLYQKLRLQFSRNCNNRHILLAFMAFEFIDIITNETQMITVTITTLLLDFGQSSIAKLEVSKESVLVPVIVLNRF